MMVNVPDDRRGGEYRWDHRFDLPHRYDIVAIQLVDSTNGMQHSHRLPASLDPLPRRFLSGLAIFADLFTRPTWSNVLVLLAGVILAPGRRTVTSALRILGRERDSDFGTFHRILSRTVWSSRAVAGRLLITSSKMVLVPFMAETQIRFPYGAPAKWMIQQSYPASLLQSYCKTGAERLWLFAWRDAGAS
jgi:hypothetical protein